MAEGPGDDNGELNERTQSIRMVRELCKGRLTEDEVSQLLQHHDWDLSRATNAFLNSDPRDLRDMFNRQNENELRAIQRDEVIRDLLMKQQISTETRQFACQPCDYVWWRKVPTRKMVSKCKRCRRKYEAIPKHQEWGWAIFVCSCGREFSGFGQMNVTKSACYRRRGGCGLLALPDRIQPPNRRRKKKSRTMHSCNAPDCPNRHESDGGHNVHVNIQPNDYIYVRGQGGNRRLQQRHPVNQPAARCIHPITRQNKPKVIVPSMEHRSTGSTVATFLDQGDLCSLSSFQPSEDDIDEGSESGDEGGH